MTLLVAILLVGSGSMGWFIYQNHTEKVDAASNQQEPFHQFTKENQKINSEKTRDFIQINGNTYKNTEFDKFKARKQLFQKLKNQQQPKAQARTLSDNQIRQQFVERKALLDAAKTQHVQVSKTEAKAYAEKVRKALNQSNDPDTQQVKSYNEDVRKSLGLSEDEYWNDFAVPMYQELLSIGKLKQQFFHSAEWKNKDYNTVQKAWNQYTEQLTKQASVKMLH